MTTSWNWLRECQKFAKLSSRQKGYLWTLKDLKYKIYFDLSRCPNFWLVLYTTTQLLFQNLGLWCWFSQLKCQDKWGLPSHLPMWLSLPLTVTSNTYLLLMSGNELKFMRKLARLAQIIWHSILINPTLRHTIKQIPLYVCVCACMLLHIYEHVWMQ